MPQRTFPFALFSLVAAALFLAGCIALPHQVADPLWFVDRSESKLAPALARAEELRMQVIVTRFEEKDGRLDSTPTSWIRAGAEYFYPASTIKLCGAVSALLEFKRVFPPADDLELWGMLNLPMAYHPLDGNGPIDDTDPSNLSTTNPSAITIGHEIRKLFLVSDNAAYNRLYDYVGQQRLNADMRALGLHSTRLTHRLAVGHSPEQNRRSPRIDVHGSREYSSERDHRRWREDGEWSQLIPARSFPELPKRPPPYNTFDVGVDYLTDAGPAGRPMNFADKNAISLRDLHNLTISVVRPDAAPLLDPVVKAPNLAPALRQWLLQAMSEYPADSINPRYDRGTYPDEWGKYFLPGLCRVRPKHEWTIWNKAGMAYGFLTDTAVIRHDPTGRTLAITATIYCNADGVLNDDRYDYESVGFPFFADLGEEVGRALATFETRPERPAAPVTDSTPPQPPAQHSNPTPTPTES